MEWKPSIIPIKRASESLIKALIDMGVLEVTDDGIRVKEEQAPQPTKARSLPTENSTAISSCTLPYNSQSVKQNGRKEDSHVLLSVQHLQRDV